MSDSPKIDISLITHGDDVCELGLIAQDGSLGIFASFTRRQRYDLAEALINPNGSGYRRNAGQLERTQLSPEAEAERERQIEESAKRLSETTEL